MSETVVYGVHDVRSDEVCRIDVIFTRLDAAEWHAEVAAQHRRTI